MMQETTNGINSELEDVKAELARERALNAIIFEHHPDAIAVMDKNGVMTGNPACQALWGTTNNLTLDEWGNEYGAFLADGTTPHPLDQTPMARSFATGESVNDHVMFVRAPVFPNGIYVSISSRPLPGGGSVGVMRDITERRRLEEDLAKRNSELADMVERLRLAVDDLSTPVLELWEDILALPVVGVVDTLRSSRMTERVLNEVAARRSRFLIVDLTGVEVVDTSTADRFLKLARSVELLGAECIISGIQPAVAQTLTDLGLDFGRLVTKRNLKRALEACLALTRKSQVSAEKRSA